MQPELKRTTILIAMTIAISLGGATKVLAAGVDPAKATPAQREQAQSRFLKGRDLYAKKKYDGALVELTASLDIVASPNTRLYVARCLRDMGQTVAAYVELGRTAVEAKELLHDDARYEKAAQAASDERAALAPKLGFVQISVAHAGPDTTLKVGNDEVRRGGWDEALPVVPGSSEIVVETPGHAPVKQTFQIAAGERQTVSIDAGADAVSPPVAASSHDVAGDASRAALLRPLAFATAGLAVGGLATFLIAGAKANSTYSNLQDACGSGPCPAGHDSDIAAGRTQQTIANVGLAVFAISGGASVALFVLSAPKKSPASGAAPAASARVVATPSSLSLEGGF